jgi:hypothetical protein
MDKKIIYLFDYTHTYSQLMKKTDTSLMEKMENLNSKEDEILRKTQLKMALEEQKKLNEIMKIMNAN